MLCQHALHVGVERRGAGIGRQQNLFFFPEMGLSIVLPELQKCSRGLLQAGSLFGGAGIRCAAQFERAH